MARGEEDSSGLERVRSLRPEPLDRPGSPVGYFSERYPWATAGLVLALAGGLVTQIILLALEMESVHDRLFVPSESLWMRPWTLLTAQFAHQDLGHFAENLLAFLVLAPITERLLGRWLFPAAYLGGGALATVVQVASGGTVSVGASSGVWVLIGFYFPIWLAEWSFQPRFSPQRGFPSFEAIEEALTRHPVAHELLAVAIAVQQILVIGGLMTSGTEVAHAAHLTGLAVGLGLAFSWY